jgi:hypothetical protein
MVLVGEIERCGRGRYVAPGKRPAQLAIETAPAPVERDAVTPVHTREPPGTRPERAHDTLADEVLPKKFGLGPAMVDPGERRSTPPTSINSERRSVAYAQDKPRKVFPDWAARRTGIEIFLSQGDGLGGGGHRSAAGHV